MTSPLAQAYEEYLADNPDIKFWLSAAAYCPERRDLADHARELMDHSKIEARAKQLEEVR